MNQYQSVLNIKLVNHQWWKRGKVLGTGAYAFVCEARPLPNNPLSLLLPPLMAVKSSEIENSVYREKNLLSMFSDHPHIINYYGYEDNVDSSGNIMHNIFLEYASGGSLADLIEKRVQYTGGGLWDWEVKEYVKGVLLGLKDIHNRGFVHCDIKPDNILLVDGYVPKICDFGLATKMGMGLATNLRGTPAYFAPETIKYGLYTGGADIWSLGCTVLEMVTGRCAWGFPVTEESVSFIGNYEIVPQIPKGLSHEIQDFLKCCLVRNFGDRWNAESLLSHPFLQDPFEFRSVNVGGIWTQLSMLPSFTLMDGHQKKPNLCALMKEMAI